MKTLILGLAGIVLSANVFAADLKVGDPMPVFYGQTYELSNFGRWSWKGKKKGSWVKYDKKEVLIGLKPNQFYVGDRKPEYMTVNIICEGEVMKRPFGISDFEKELVYLDLNMKGYIDKIVSNKGRRAEEDAPACPTDV